MRTLASLLSVDGVAVLLQLQRGGGAVCRAAESPAEEGLGEESVTCCSLYHTIIKGGAQENKCFIKN